MLKKLKAELRNLLALLHASRPVASLSNTPLSKLCSHPLSQSFARTLKAFTMAEMLLSLGIVSALAVIILPTFNLNVNTKHYISAMRTMSANLNDKLHAQMAVEDVSNVGDLRAFTEASKMSTDAEKIKKFYKEANKFWTLTPATEDHKNIIGLNRKKPGSGDNVVATWPRHTMSVLHTGGLIYIYQFEPEGVTREATPEDIMKKGGALYRRYAIVFIDVNAYKKPNRIGVDIFKFYLGQDGTLYPVGGKDASIFQKNQDSLWSSTSETQFNCQPESLGLGCAGRVREQGWIINYLD